MFNSRSSRPCSNDFSSPRGNGERVIFEERIVDGSKQLVATGKESLKDFIEASKSETLISNIIKRFEQGDINVLSKVQGFYADVTDMPSDLASAQRHLITLEDKFNNLPSEVKTRFDNSFNKFVEEVSHSSIDDFAKIFGFDTSISENSDVKPVVSSSTSDVTNLNGGENNVS